MQTEVSDRARAEEKKERKEKRETRLTVGSNLNSSYPSLLNNESSVSFSADPEQSQDRKPKAEGGQFFVVSLRKGGKEEEVAHQFHNSRAKARRVRRR